MHYGFSWFDTNAGDSGSTGHSASASYTREVLGFNTGVGAQVSHMLQARSLGTAKMVTVESEHCTSVVAGMARGYRRDVREE